MRLDEITSEKEKQQLDEILPALAAGAGMLARGAVAAGGAALKGGAALAKGAGTAIAKGAQAVGSAVKTGAQAVGQGVGNVAQAAQGAAAQGGQMLGAEDPAEKAKRIGL